MSDTIELEDEIIEDEVRKMGSVNHSIAQTRTSTLLSSDERFEVLVELSLDGSQIDLKRFGLKTKDEIVPDISVYIGSAPIPDEEIEDDILKASQMPDLAIEILSPSQSIGMLVRKIKAYFALGVKSCWLIVPPMKVINIYSKPSQSKTFDMNDTEVVDEVMDIRLPIQKVFSRRQSVPQMNS